MGTTTDYKKLEAITLAETYGFFPHNDMRFESTNVSVHNSWGFYANKSNRTLIHIKYDPTLLEFDF